MKIGIDITNFSPVAKVGINRYTSSLVHAMLQITGERDMRFYISRPRHWVREEELTAIRESFPGVPISVAFDGLVPYLPGELNTARRLRLSGVLAHAHPMIRRAYTWFNRSTSAWVSPLRKACADVPLIEEPDVMHHMRSVYYPFRRRPNVLTVHDLTPLLFPQWHVPEVRAAFRPTSRFARRCAAVIAVSENTRKDAHRLMKTPLDRIHTVHEAADKVFRVAEDHAQVMERLAEHGLAGRSFLLFVGTLEPRKNLPGLLRAFARLRELLPGEPPLLVLAGSKGWLYEPIFREIERLALAAHVRHIENANDETVAALMNAAVALVYPSYYEGFGLPPLEAMACGCPVITSNTSSLPEVVGDAGILAAPDDVRQIAEAMRRVCLDANFREDLRRRGLRRAAAFSWERAAKQTLEVYEKVVHPT